MSKQNKYFGGIAGKAQQFCESQTLRIREHRISELSTIYIGIHDLAQLHESHVLTCRCQIQEICEFSTIANMTLRQLDEAIRAARVDVENAEQAARNAAQLLQFCETCAGFAQRDLETLLKQRDEMTTAAPRSSYGGLHRNRPSASATPTSAGPIGAFGGRQASRSPRRQVREPGVPEPTHPLIIELIREIMTMPQPHVEGAWLSHLNTGCDSEILAEYRKPGSGSMARLGRAIREVANYDLWLHFGNTDVSQGMNDMAIIVKAACMEADVNVGFIEDKAILA